MTRTGFSVSRYAPQRGPVARLTARDSVLRRLDWPMLLSALALSFLGALLVWSATRNRTELNQGDPYYFLFRHVLNAGIGLALMIGTIWLGHRTLRGAVPVLYGISLVLILAVLTPLGATINGAHAWIVVGGGFSLQPSEFVKITIILIMAMLLAAKVDAGDQLHPDHGTVAKALGLAALIGVLHDPLHCRRQRRARPLQLLGHQLGDQTVGFAHPQIVGSGAPQRAVGGQAGQQELGEGL